jgi:hypothetical protein
MPDAEKPRYILSFISAGRYNLRAGHVEGTSCGHIFYAGILH